MADTEWIKKIINVRGIYCPLYDGPCPGHRNPAQKPPLARGCVFWLPLVVKDSRGGDAEIVEGCSFLWELVQRNEATLETIRSIATSDKLASEVHGVAQSIKMATSLKRRRDPEVIDAEEIKEIENV